MIASQDSLPSPCMPSINPEGTSWVIQCNTMLSSGDPAFIHGKVLKGVTLMADTQNLKYANAIN